MTLPVQPKWTLTLLIRIWEQEFGREKAAPTVPGEELMCQDPGEIQSYSVSSSLWYRTHCNGSPVGTAISTPFDSIISWVTFSSWLQRKPGSPTPARSKAAWSSVAGRQMHVCDSSGGLAAVSHQLTESFHETALRGSQGPGVLCGDCSFVLPGKGNTVWGHAWLRKESLTLVQCMICHYIFLPLTIFLWCLVAGQG